MKTHIAATVASILLASLGTAAYAQGGVQIPPQPATPPQQVSPPQAPPQQMPPRQMQQVPQQQAMPPMSSRYDQSTSNQTHPGNSTLVVQEIKQALRADGITATHVNVAFSGGTATLSGSVFNKHDIAKAKAAALHVHGVTHVDASNLHARKPGSHAGL